MNKESLASIARIRPPDGLWPTQCLVHARAKCRIAECTAHLNCILTIGLPGKALERPANIHHMQGHIALPVLAEVKLPIPCEAHPSTSSNAIVQPSP